MELCTRTIQKYQKYKLLVFTKGVSYDLIHSLKISIISSSNESLMDSVGKESELKYVRIQQNDH